MLRGASLLICFLVSASLTAATVKDTIHINRGQMMLIDSTFVPRLAYNKDTNFTSKNHVIRISPGDSLHIVVINNDAESHRFNIKDVLWGDTAQAGDTIVHQIHFPTTGCFIYGDWEISDVTGIYMGLGGMVVVADPSQTSYLWNISELNKGWNHHIDSGGGVNWTDYHPDYFLINGRSNPDINMDSTARVTGNVGDTIYIYIANTGRSAHSIHFHGYHCEIESSSRFPNHVGRSKDTFALYQYETMVLRLVPDKPGEFPVHDHNLVAITAGSFYPNGMFLTILIQ
jgi:FtsP/CotA-like multicopper oxidase with cupredoxin domain